MKDNNFDAIVIGAGAAGALCAIEGAKRGKKIKLIDHSKKFGEKIRISGGGKCNFTNIHCGPEHFISSNPKFCLSALNQFNQNDFIALLEENKIPYHEKKMGQLFCDNSAKDILRLLNNLSAKYRVDLSLAENIVRVQAIKEGFSVATSSQEFTSKSLVVATGGLSIPKIGATKFGYEIAKKFKHQIIEPRPGLVPLVFKTDLLNHCKDLTGVSLLADVSYKGHSFKDGLLFTHRGLSGPSILQVSSYWLTGEPISIDLAPENDIEKFLIQRKDTHPTQKIQNALSEILPKRIALAICQESATLGTLANLSHKAVEKLRKRINRWQVYPQSTEGYRTAEVTVGGINTRTVSSKTMESLLHSGLYFVGEVLDVTGHLGGHNFQWAWSSGWVAGQNL